MQARNLAIAEREKLREENKVIKQRKARQHQLRIRHRQRQHENYEKEASLGITRRQRPPALTEHPRESTQPITKKDWRYYRRGEENLWTDYYHIPLNRLEHVIPEVAVKKDKEAVDRVMKLLAEEDANAEHMEQVKMVKIARLRKSFSNQMENNRRMSDFIFRDVRSFRPSSAAAIRASAPENEIIDEESDTEDDAENLRNSGNNHSSSAGTGGIHNSQTKSKKKQARPQSAPALTKTRQQAKEGQRKPSIFDRLSRPRQAVKKHKLALQTGCAELKGMLVTDRALNEQLAHLSQLRSSSRSKSKQGAKTLSSTRVTIRAQSPSEEVGRYESNGNKDNDPELGYHEEELKKFDEKIAKNPGRYIDNGLYNSVSIYE